MMRIYQRGNYTRGALPDSIRIFKTGRFFTQNEKIKKVERKLTTRVEDVFVEVEGQKWLLQLVQERLEQMGSKMWVIIFTEVHKFT